MTPTSYIETGRRRGNRRAILLACAGLLGWLALALGPGAAPARASCTPALPIATVSRPTITGKAAAGKLLTAHSGTFRLACGTSATKYITSYAYEWWRCKHTYYGPCSLAETWTYRSKATETVTYRLMAKDVGWLIEVQESVCGGACVEGGGATSKFTSRVVRGVPTIVKLPRILGSAVEGQTLRAKPGKWSPAPLDWTYHWLRCNVSGLSCRRIVGATSYTYTLKFADVGHTIRVRVAATDAGGTSAPYKSRHTAVVLPLAPSIVEGPSIDGDLTQHRTLTAVAYWANHPASLTYQWKSCPPSPGSCTVVGTTSAYTLGASDVGNTIVLTESASNAGGTGGPVSSAATGPVAAAGAAKSAPVNSLPPLIYPLLAPGQTLFASTGAWEGTPLLTYSYQWQLCNPGCVNISGATGPTYTVATVYPSYDRAGYIRVLVTATNSVGAGQASSNELGPVPTVPPHPGGGGSGPPPM